MPINREVIVEFLAGEIGADLAKRGMTSVRLTEEFNFIDTGTLDSLSFLRLVRKIEDRFGVEIDMGDVEPADISTVGGLASLIHSQTAGC